VIRVPRVRKNMAVTYLLHSEQNSHKIKNKNDLIPQKWMVTQVKKPVGLSAVDSMWLIHQETDKSTCDN
jgi:predicted lipase